MLTQDQFENEDTELYLCTISLDTTRLGGQRFQSVKVGKEPHAPPSTPLTLITDLVVEEGGGREERGREVPGGLASGPPPRLIG